MFPHSSRLQVDYGDALSCYERALLYSTNSEGSKSAECFDDADGYRYITSIYLNSANLLIQRLAEVSKIYFVKYKAILKQRVAIGDRTDEDWIYLSRDIVIGNFFDLITSITLQHDRRTPAERRAAIQVYRRDWKGLDRICRLLMDEITYLSDRVDGFTNILATRVSINVALLGIYLTFGATVIFGLIQTYFSSKSIPNTRPTEELKEVSEKLGQISEAINGLANAITKKEITPLVINISPHITVPPLDVIVQPPSVTVQSPSITIQPPKIIVPSPKVSVLPTINVPKQESSKKTIINFGHE